MEISTFAQKMEVVMDQKARWICHPEYQKLTPIKVFKKQLDPTELPVHEESLKNRHTLVRKTFILDTVPETAILSISADDYYKLYINGCYVAQGPAPSYYTDYKYNQMDIAKYLQKGKNVLAVHIYYQGLINRVWTSGDYRQGMIASLDLGDRYIVTDDSWKYADTQEYVESGKVGYDTQYLENIDARLQIHGWKTLDFEDHTWYFMAIKEKDDHRLVQQITPVLEVYPVEPVAITNFGPGHFLLDYGKEQAGCLRLQAKGERGEQVRVLCGEELQSDGHVRFDMRSGCRYEEIWTLSGQEDELENFDYKALRYVEIETSSSAITPASITLMAQHYPYRNPSVIDQCSEPLLKEIWDLCARGVQIGSQEVFVDCPGREKGQYLGDMAVTAMSHLYLTGDSRLYKKALYDFRGSTAICPGMMIVAPASLMQEIADFSLLYPLELLHYYEYTRDRETLADLYPTAKGVVEYFARYEREDRLLRNVKDKWNLVDWPSNLRDDYDFPLDIPVGEGCHNVINAYYYGALKTLAAIEAILELPITVDPEPVRQSFQKVFYRPEKHLFADSEQSNHCSLHANGIALFYGMADETQAIVDFIVEKGLCCGVFVSYFILKSLCQSGQYQAAYDLILNTSDHSWVNMLREGATSCFEVWGKDQKNNMSLCHPWASAPIIILIEDLLGLSSDDGWKTVQINPHLPKQLKSLSMSLTTQGGQYTVTVADGVVRVNEA